VNSPILVFARKFIEFWMFVVDDITFNIFDISELGANVPRVRRGLTIAQQKEIVVRPNKSIKSTATRRTVKRVCI
jgi:hypothetical protein